MDVDALCVLGDVAVPFMIELDDYYETTEIRAGENLSERNYNTKILKSRLEELKCQYKEEGSWKEKTIPRLKAEKLITSRP